MPCIEMAGRFARFCARIAQIGLIGLFWVWGAFEAWTVKALIACTPSFARCLPLGALALKGVCP